MPGHMGSIMIFQTPAHPVGKGPGVRWICSPPSARFTFAPVAATLSPLT